MTIVRRLTVVLALALCAVFAVDSLLHLRRLSVLYEADVRRDQAVLARVLAPVLTATWSAQGEAAARALLGEIHRYESETRVRLVHLDAPAGGSFAPDVTDGGLRGAAPGIPITFVRAGDGGPRVYTYVPLSLAGAPDTAVEISESEAAGQHLFVEPRLRGLVVTAGVMALVSALFVWVAGARLVGRPIAALVEKARRTAEGDFSRPIPALGHDELSNLAREMNAMADRLRLSSERLAAETAARMSALEQLRHADRLTTIGTLAAGLAHELGTPLAVVSGQARRIATGDVADDAEAAALANVVIEQAERMTRIVRGLLDFARRGPTARRAGAVLDWVGPAVGLLRPLARRAGVAIELDAEPDVPAARVDPTRVQQALANLVMNAVQASSKGGTVTVRVGRIVAAPPGRPDAPRPCLALDVLDRGTGIPDDVVAKVFDPFFTTKPVGEGTGLGLAVAHGIVAEHEGWIEVETETGRGSRFGIRIPYDDERAVRGEVNGEENGREPTQLHAAVA